MRQARTCERLYQDGKGLVQRPVRESKGRGRSRSTSHPRMKRGGHDRSAGTRSCTFRRKDPNYRLDDEMSWCAVVSTADHVREGVRRRINLHTAGDYDKNERTAELNQPDNSGVTLLSSLYGPRPMERSEVLVQTWSFSLHA